MARYKAIDTSPRFLAVDLEKQLLPGSFEHAVNHLLDHEFDLALFDSRYRNDQSGTSAYPPGMLLKVILRAYAQGVVSSRGIERLCREHVMGLLSGGDDFLRVAVQIAHHEVLLDDINGKGHGKTRVLGSWFAILMSTFRAFKRCEPSHEFPISMLKWRVSEST